MKTSEELRKNLRTIDHKSYPAYKSLAGSYSFGKYTLNIEHVQGDPFAAPSRLSVQISHKIACFPDSYYEAKWKKTALEDYLLRRFHKQADKFCFQAKGSGKSGIITVSRCGQEILERTACEITTGSVIVRFEAGFPANGRTINATELEKILFEFVPVCVEQSLFYENTPKKDLEKVIFLAEDQHFIREEMKKQDMVAFVADGSVLPRESGVSDRPLKDGIPFSSPETMAVTLDLPHRGKVRGMGVKKGITLIVGGGYHGKSTLLKALERGVYDHISGDGREYVITEKSALKLRAEDGRKITNTDISLFINHLPNGKNTESFCTLDASGSTSQAANTVEAMEAGAQVFLIDEDTSATNFMIRDELMQRVVSRDVEPIIPFIDRVRELYEDYGISTILVAGSCGSYFHKADCIIQMNKYQPVEITALAKKEAEGYPYTTGKLDRSAEPNFKRVVKKDTAFAKDDRIKLRTDGLDGFSVNREEVDMRYVEQLADSEQLTSLSYMIKYMKLQVFDGKKTLKEAVEELYTRIESRGFSAFFGTGDGAAAGGEGGTLPGNLAMPRRQELYAALNRCRELIRIAE